MEASNPAMYLGLTGFAGFARLGAFVLPEIEHLADGIDNDCDGDIDCDDADALLTDPISFTFNSAPTISGTPATVGYSANYHNVAVIGGTPVDLVGTIQHIDISTGASLTATFNTTDIGLTQGITGGIVGDTSEATVTWQLFENGNSNIISSDFFFSVSDIELIPGQGKEFIELKVPEVQSYFTTNPTNLLIDFLGNDLRLEGTTTASGEPQNGVSAYYNSTSSFQVVYGLENLAPSGSANASHIIADSLIFTPCLEICNNGIDDDSDGLTDCNDPDCITSPSIITSLTTACINEVIVISSSDIGSGATYSWNFGTAASPATATGIGPHNVSYTTCGSKTISLDVLRNGCSLSVDSIIAIVDNSAPVWTVDPQDLIMECLPSANYSDSISLWVANFGYGIASDNCSSFKITNDYSSLNGDCGTTASTTVQFTAIDSCSNATIRTASIQIVDTNAPIISNVSDVTVDCDVVPGAASPTVADSCDATIGLAYQEVIVQHPDEDWNSIGSCSQLYQITTRSLR